MANAEPDEQLLFPNALEKRHFGNLPDDLEAFYQALFYGGATEPPQRALRKVRQKYGICTVSGTHREVLSML